MTIADTHLSFWGKARPTAEPPSPQYHPVAYHLLDVAAVMEAILDARPITLARVARLLRAPEEEAQRLLVALAGLHDLGKFAPAFQAQVPALWPAMLGPRGAKPILPGRHTEDGYVLWIQAQVEAVGERVWPGAARTLEVLAAGVFGHHGRPAGRHIGELRQRFPRPAQEAARECAAAVLDLVCPEPLAAPPLDPWSARVASWYVAGMMTTADWIGSGVHWFPYTAPLDDDASLAGYWRQARKAARDAVREAGLAAPAAASPRPFAELTRQEGSPTPLQRWAETASLPAGPLLVVVEDVTGAGKTEAAQMIVHRLMAAGRVSGAYWAMPTQATANAMYGRQSAAVGLLYAGGEGPKPSLVLAHGQQRLHKGFRGTVLPGAGDPAKAVAEVGAGAGDELPGTLECAAFLADDRRAALLADVGAGTVDQALLAVLPSRFNTVRLVGLADKALVVDEVHAYDAYMGEEVQELLRFQAALGGSAVVLSATLPFEKRGHLGRAWREGLEAGGWTDRGDAADDAQVVESDAYPLVTTVSAEGVREEPLDPASWSSRTVGIRWVHELDEALAYVKEKAGQRAAVAWIRNTVDDCLLAAERLRAEGIEDVVVFHARFAQCDRQAREGEVLRWFGPGSTAADRAGRVVVATQVIEQSLDLDFDAMVSDLAPVDLLIQRAGRLWRHPTRPRPPGCERELMVLSPRREADPPKEWLGGIFAGTAAVYRNAAVLWRTIEALTDAERIETPSGLRELVERVYASEDEPTGLQEQTNRAIAKEYAAMQQALHNALKVADGYDAGGVAWLNELYVPTRLGEVQTTVRLARVRPDGSLVPWAVGEPLAWKAWALSEVRLRAYRVPWGSAALPMYEAAVGRVRQEWGRFEQDISVLPLEEVGEGRWRGILVRPEGAGPVGIEYASDTGVVFPPAP